MSGKRVSILQPSYMPWQGHFDQMDFSDVFLFFDDVQYTKRSWRSRNRVRCGERDLMLTVPVANAHRPLPLIKDTLIIEDGWRKKHLKTLSLEYHHTPFFDETYPFVEQLILHPVSNLCDFNIYTMTSIARWIGIDTPLGKTSDIPSAPGLDSQQRIVECCRSVGASILYNGQTAKTILDDAWFRSEGICIEYQVFMPVAHPQASPGFMSHLSVLDALFCVGREACLSLIRQGHRSPDIL